MHILLAAFVASYIAAGMFRFQSMRLTVFTPDDPVEVGIRSFGDMSLPARSALVTTLVIAVLLWPLWDLASLLPNRSADK